MSCEHFSNIFDITIRVSMIKGSKESNWDKHRNYTLLMLIDLSWSLSVSRQNGFLGITQILVDGTIWIMNTIMGGNK